jgi:hypothetical protein
MADAKAVQGTIQQNGLKLTRSTAGTHVFEVSADGKATAHISTVYVKKSAFLGNAPAQEYDLVMTPRK